MDKLNPWLATILEWGIFISAYKRDSMVSITVFYGLIKGGCL